MTSFISGAGANATSKTSGTTITVDPASATAIPVGRLMIALVGFDNLSATTPTVTFSDTAGNTWTTISQTAMNATAAAGCGGAIGVSYLTTEFGTTDTVTATFSGAITAKAMTVGVFSGLLDVEEVADVVASGTSTTPSVTSGSASSGNAVIGLMVNELDQTGANDTDTTNGSWAVLGATNTTGGSGASNIGIRSNYKITTGSGTQTYNPVLTSSADWVCLVVVLVSGEKRTATSSGTGSSSATGSKVTGPQTVSRTATSSGAGSSSATRLVTDLRTAASSGTGGSSAVGARLMARTGLGLGFGDNNAALTLGGTSGTSVRSPDSALFDFTSDVDLIVRVSTGDWTPAAISDLVSKSNTNLNQQSWRLGINTSGLMRFAVSETGGTSTVVLSSANLSAFTPSQAYWLKASVDVDNGSGGFTVTFSWANDQPSEPLPSQWTQLGTPQSSTALGTLLPFSGTANLRLGNNDNGTAPLVGTLYRVIGRQTSGLMFDWNPTVESNSFTDINGSLFTVLGTGNSWTAASPPSSVASRVVVRGRTATAAGTGSSSASGAVLVLARTAFASGTGTSSASGTLIRARTATSSGVGLFDSTGLVTRIRSAAASGVGSGTAAPVRKVTAAAVAAGVGVSVVVSLKASFRTGESAGSSAQSVWSERIFEIPVPLRPRQMRKKFFPPPSKPVGKGKPLQPPRVRW